MKINKINVASLPGPCPSLGHRSAAALFILIFNPEREKSQFLGLKNRKLFFIFAVHSAQGFDVQETRL